VRLTGARRVSLGDTIQWRTVIITIIGWLSLIKGLLLINTFVNSAIIRKYLKISPWLVLILGIVSLYLGFVA
jgi:hypothetical protein